MKPPLLPPVPDVDAWATTQISDEAWRAALELVGARHGFDARGAARSPRGSTPVFLTDDRAVKFVPPPWVGELPREVAALERVHGRLPARTPEVLATGALDDWRYLVSERVPGVSLRDAAPAMSRDARV